MTDETAWRVRATAWELLAVSFRYPQGELAHAVASGEWTAAAREVAGALDAVLPEDFGEGLPGADASPEEVLHELRIEATRLLIGAPTPAVHAFEGLRRSEDGPERELMFVNRHALEVERFCKAAGFDRPEGTNEPLDHIATECELMEYLALVASGVEVAKAEDCPGGSAEAAYESFKAWHMDAWVPAFAEDVVHESRHPFFQAAGSLMSALYPRL